MSEPGKPASKKARNTTTASAYDAIKTLLQDLQQERANRDKQLSTLMQEISQGFMNIHEDVDSRDVRRNQEITQLISGLENAFAKVESASKQREGRSEELIARLSESIILDHQHLHEEAEDKERLHDKKLQQLDKIQREQVRRTRLIAIPGVITAIFAVVYMFYTVHVMERAMTSISHDMQAMQSISKDMQAVTSIAQDMRVMRDSMETVSSNTSGMSNNMAHLRRDMGVMTQNVAPAMSGIRQMMPWMP